MLNPCRDCVDIFRHDPSWDSPGDVQWRETYQEYLCGACMEDRDARSRAFKAGEYSIREILKQARESLTADDVDGFYATVYSVRLLAAHDDRFRAWVNWDISQATRSMMQNFCAHAERMIRQEDGQ